MYLNGDRTQLCQSLSYSVLQLWRKSGKTLNSVNSSGGWNWLPCHVSVPSIHQASWLLLAQLFNQVACLVEVDGTETWQRSRSLQPLFIHLWRKPSDAEAARQKIRVSSARLMTLPHPSGRPPSPVITPLIVQGWQPFCCCDTRHRLQSNETWRESGNLLAQIFEMQTISITASFSLSVCASQCVAFFCVPVPRMLCRRTSPRDKSQNDSLDRELSRREE